MQTVAETSASTKPLLSPDEFLKEMQGTIGRNSVYGLIQANRIKHVRLGRKILIPRSELTDFLVREVQEQK